MAYITTAHADPAVQRREPIWCPKIDCSISFFSLKCNIAIFVRTCYAMSKLVERRWNLNGVFVLRPTCYIQLTLMPYLDLLI